MQRITPFFYRLSDVKKILVIILVLVMGEAAASSMTIVELPATGTDDAIDISSEKTYTHTLDFGKNSPATINGVAFEQGVTKEVTKLFNGTSKQGFGYTLYDTRWDLPEPKKMFYFKIHLGNDVTAYCDGSSADMFLDMLYFDEAQKYKDEGIIVTLKDLEPGAKYSVRYYYRSWDPPLPRPLSMYGDAESNGIFKDSIKTDIDITRLGAQYIDYTFVTDDSDVALKFIYNEFAQGSHIYGLTCEKVQKTAIDSKRNITTPIFAVELILPNTFNRNRAIQYRIPQDDHVMIKVFNQAGKQMATAVDGFKKAGEYTVNLEGASLRSGVYICKMTVGGTTLEGRVVVAK